MASTVHHGSGASESSPSPTFAAAFPRSAAASGELSRALPPPMSGPDRPPTPFSSIRFSLCKSSDGSFAGSSGGSKAPEKIREAHQEHPRALVPLIPLTSSLPKPSPAQQPLHNAEVGSSLAAWLPSLLEAEALASPEHEEQQEPHVGAAAAEDDSGPPPLGSTISSMAPEEDRDASGDSDLAQRDRWALVIAELEERFRRRDQKRPMEPPSQQSPDSVGLRMSFQCQVRGPQDRLHHLTVSDSSLHRGGSIECHHVVVSDQAADSCLDVPNHSWLLQPDTWGASSSNASSSASARAAAHSRVSANRMLFEAESSEAPLPGDDSDNDTAFDPEETAAKSDGGLHRLAGKCSQLEGPAAAGRGASSGAFHVLESPISVP